MYVLGLNHGRNSTAALIKDGDVIAAVEQERYNREKGTTKYPEGPIKYCLDYAGIDFEDLDAITFSYKMSIGFWPSVFIGLRYFPKSLKAFGVRVKQWFYSSNYVKLMSRQFGVSESKVKAKCHYLEHHLCHSANAFFCSNYDSAAILSIDGSGEIDTLLMSHARDIKIEKIGSVRFPHSVGMLYNTFTQFTGFKIDNGEGKVMGLAPYGDPAVYRDFFKKVITPLPDGKFKMDMSYFRYHFTANKKEPFFSKKVEAVLGKPRVPESDMTKRDENISASLQEATEEIGVHIAKYLQEKTGDKNLCITGGVALNSVMNNRILKETAFDSVYVYPASQDAGTAVGGALYYYYCMKGNKRIAHVNQSPYLGPEYTDTEIEEMLKRRNISYRRVDDAGAAAAALIFDKKIIGWFQGREELGPRALGSRSIICDPRPEDMKDYLNNRVKHREPFRPFAPAVKIEKYREYFDIDFSSPYMLFVCDAKEEIRGKIRATLHVDNTARLQTVSREDHEEFWGLIDAFEKLSGVPVVLNTSFNVRGEPIVLAPEDGLNCYLGTNLDALVMGHFVIEKAGRVAI